MKNKKDKESQSKKMTQKKFYTNSMMMKIQNKKNKKYYFKKNKKFIYNFLMDQYKRVKEEILKRISLNIEKMQ